MAWSTFTPNIGTARKSLVAKMTLLQRYGGGYLDYNEGENAMVVLWTDNVRQLSTLYWSINHITTNDNDFDALSGTATYQYNFATISIPIAADQLTEGTDETFTITIRIESPEGPIIGISDTMTIHDTSLTVFTGGTLPTDYMLAGWDGTTWYARIVSTTAVQASYAYSTDLTNWTTVSIYDQNGDANYTGARNTLVPSPRGLYYVQSTNPGAILWFYNSFYGGFIQLTPAYNSSSSAQYRYYWSGDDELLISEDLYGSWYTPGSWASGWWTISYSPAGDRCQNLQPNIGHGGEWIVIANYNDSNGVRLVYSQDHGASWSELTPATWTPIPDTAYAKSVVTTSQSMGPFGPQFLVLFGNGSNLLSASSPADITSWMQPFPATGARPNGTDLWVSSTLGVVFMTHSGASDNLYISFCSTNDPTSWSVIGPFDEPIEEIYDNGTQVFGSTTGGAIVTITLPTTVTYSLGTQYSSNGLLYSSTVFGIVIQQANWSDSAAYSDIISRSGGQQWTLSATGLPDITVTASQAWADYFPGAKIQAITPQPTDLGWPSGNTEITAITRAID